MVGTSTRLFPKVQRLHKHADSIVMWFDVIAAGVVTEAIMWPCTKLYSAGGSNCDH